MLFVTTANISIALLQDAIEKNKASLPAQGAAESSSVRWPTYSPTMLGSLFYSGEKTKLDVADAVVNILFPIVGVLALKSMKKAKNIRETIELTVPVCGMNSLCTVCIILMQNSLCLSRHLSSTISMADATVSDTDYMPNMHSQTTDRNKSMPVQANVQSHYQQSDDRAIVRFQPILAALALPFPLVCSIVCIVTAGRNHRVMVRTNKHALTLLHT